MGEYIVCTSIAILQKIFLLSNSTGEVLEILVFLIILPTLFSNSLRANKILFSAFPKLLPSNKTTLYITNYL